MVKDNKVSLTLRLVLSLLLLATAGIMAPRLFGSGLGSGRCGGTGRNCCCDVNCANCVDACGAAVSAARTFRAGRNGRPNFFPGPASFPPGHKQV
jgi:hypothetical protein